MGNLDRAMSSGAAALDLTSDGLTTTSNSQYPRRKKDLCGYHCLNSFVILVPGMGVFFATEANN